MLKILNAGLHESYFYFREVNTGRTSRKLKQLKVKQKRQPIPDYLFVCQ
jgi:hypothetical protein